MQNQVNGHSQAGPSSPPAWANKQFGPSNPATTQQQQIPQGQRMAGMPVNGPVAACTAPPFVAEAFSSQSFLEKRLEEIQSALLGKVQEMLMEQQAQTLRRSQIQPPPGFLPRMAMPGMYPGY